MTDDSSSTPNSRGLPPPPVPERLREMLKDHPDHIERLQEVLNQVAYDGRVLLMPFDQAIWALEGRLETFIHEAKADLEAAQVDEDAQAIELARAKEDLMFRARSSNGGMKGLHDLWNYFKENEDAL
ncbi:hypothetical protein [Lysobacter antibioticus]|uniref:hypothetical protein n=2 Tax=Lysobacter antibioticus TaxID=84531 RepID=UPI001F2D1821|nr:hypothetical protein [Lysobacter antibioticus]